MKKKSNLNELLGEESIDDLWEGMPEYQHEVGDGSVCKILFRFKTKEDLEEFSKLIGQNLTLKTKSAWYPKLESDIGLFRYIDGETNDKTV